MSASPISPDAFRQAMRHWASGVAVVTTQFEGTMRAILITSFLSLSVDPPTVLVSIRRDGLTHDLIQSSGIFAVHLLAADQEDLAQRLGYQNDASYRTLTSIPWRIGQSGAPILLHSLTYLDCRVTNALDTVDHTLFIGEVVDSSITDAEPLLHWNRAFRRLSLER